MDKRVIFAVAGSGKTTHIISQLNLDNRILIITYTNNNIKNLRNGILEKFGFFPENITLFPYFTFIYSFCFKPFLSYDLKTKGINYKPNPNKYASKSKLDYYVDKNRRVYGNRIAILLKKYSVLEDVNSRLEKYFDNIFIDEIQDFAGNDFNFLKTITKTDINMLFVGDFFQHTFDTSRDGNVNKNLHKYFSNYIRSFEEMGITVDTKSLLKSYRCSPTICSFIAQNLNIEIESHKTDDTIVTFIEDEEKANELFKDKDIVKLFYNEHFKYKCFSCNWGDSKGENHYNNICVVLNKKTLEYYLNKKLDQLPPTTKNKFYVACTRANYNLYFVSYEYFKKYKVKL